MAPRNDSGMCDVETDGTHPAIARQNRCTSLSMASNRHVIQASLSSCKSSRTVRSRSATSRHFAKRAAELTLTIFELDWRHLRVRNATQARIWSNYSKEWKCRSIAS